MNRRIEKLENQTGVDKSKREPQLIVITVRGYTCGLKAQGIECPHVKETREKMEADAKEYPVFARFVHCHCDTCKDAVKATESERRDRFRRIRKEYGNPRC